MLFKSFSKTLSLLVLTLGLTACASKKDKVEAKQASLYFGAGTQSLMQQEYTEALKNLLKANQLDPENPEILNNLAMAYYFKGEKDLAIKYLNQVLVYDKSNSDARTNLASIYYRDNRFNEAEKLYKTVLKDLTYDKQARTLFNLGILELNVRKNSVAAENYLKKSVKEDSNYCPAHLNLGIIQFRRRQFNTALRSFKEASMGTCYESPAPHYYQALSLIELKKYVEARMKLDEVDSRFKKSLFAVKARTKLLDLNELEKIKPSESHASRKMLESPDF